MAKKTDEAQKAKQRVLSVLQILRKQSPLTIKQEKFCNNGRLEMFLKAKGDSVKKAAKMLRACLTWRDSIGIDTLMADEFSAELAEGIAYVAGHDDEWRPILIFRIKQDYHKFHSQKSFTRLLAFTLEVAIQTMPKNVDQFVLLFDASFYRSASPFMNMLLLTLKMVADYYPTRLYKAYVIDPPSIFPFLWKGVKPFVELSPITAVITSLDYDDSLDYNDFSSYPRRASSLRFDSSSSSVASSAKVGPCSSSRFSFTVSHHFDSVKPWYLSLTDTSKVGPSQAFSGPGISPHNARSYSFASPRGNNVDFVRKNFFPSTPMPQKTQIMDLSTIRHPRTPKASFLQSPAMFFRREPRVGKCREAFVPLLRFYRRPYDEMVYRAMMRPPLGGLVSIVSPQLRRRHVSISQRF